MCVSLLQYFILVMILFFVDLTLAELKKCSDASDKHLELCVEGESVLEWILLTHLIICFLDNS